jgi:hypothetical protein
MGIIAYLGVLVLAAIGGVIIVVAAALSARKE